MEIEGKMEYAINLADLDYPHEFEDLFKLASLCEEISKLRCAGQSANIELESEFSNKISLFYEMRGTFRSEIERFSHAKKLIVNINESKKI